VGRVVITNVSPLNAGGVSVDFAVEPAGDGSNLAASDVASSITAAVQNGSISNVDITVSPVVSTYCDDGTTGDCSSSSSRKGLAIGLGVGIPLGLVAIGLTWYGVKRSRASKYGRVADRNRGQLLDN